MKENRKRNPKKRKQKRRKWNRINCGKRKQKTFEQTNQQTHNV